jgi:hypothetical protein
LAVATLQRRKASELSAPEKILTFIFRKKLQCSLEHRQKTHLVTDGGNGKHPRGQSKQFKSSERSGLWV